MGWMSDAETLEPIQRLTRDLKKAAAGGEGTTPMSLGEVRFLVDAYYTQQDNRKRTDSQVKALTAFGEPHEVIAWLFANTDLLERNIKNALDAYSSCDFMGRWSRSIMGIGPVISAGLSAHIDIKKAPTVGHIWRFAGLDPTTEWKKGKKRPWNAALKVLCWKIGESFVKVHNNEHDVYGHLYADRKAKEEAKNENGDFADQAAAKLERFKIGKTTDAYKAYSTGILPKGHIHARAKRWAVKLFLAHWHAVAYRHEFGTNAPKPYVLEHLGHTHAVQVPNWPF